MAEEKAVQAEQPAQAEEQPQGEPEAKETDWKAEARKWEARAKKSAQAELELEALKQAQMTEQEKERARADKAEQELAAMKAEQQRYADAKEIAAREEVPLNLLEFCADREAMEAFAKLYKAGQPSIHSAAPAPSSRISSTDSKQLSDGEKFAQAMAGIIR